jgi:hypothetical protein
VDDESISDMEMHPSLMYLNAVRKHWGSLVTGGVFIGGLGIWQGLGHSVAPWVYWLVAILGLAVASFFAWNDEHQKLVAEQHRNEGSRIEGEMIIALVDSKKSTPHGTLEPLTSGCFVTVLLTATNLNPAPAYLYLGGIVLSIQIEGKPYEGKYESLAHGRIEFTCLAEEVSIPYRNMTDFFFGGLNRFPMEDGVPRNGWLRFYVEDLEEKELIAMNEPQATLGLILKDSRHKLHPIENTVRLQLNKIRHMSDPI